jgi:hypothetical protein
MSAFSRDRDASPEELVKEKQTTLYYVQTVLDNKKGGCRYEYRRTRCARRPKRIYERALRKPRKPRSLTGR